MGDKAKTLHAMRCLKLVDRIFRSAYCCHCVLPFIRDPVCIVGLMPNTLQNDECFREFLDFTRESLHCLNLLASVFLRFRIQVRGKPDAKPRCFLCR